MYGRKTKTPPWTLIAFGLVCLGIAAYILSQDQITVKNSRSAFASTHIPKRGDTEYDFMVGWPAAFGTLLIVTGVAATIKKNRSG